MPKRPSVNSNPIFAVWEVPHERRKNRRHTTGPFIIPLPAQAVEWVRELIKLADGNEYLLPVNPIRGAGLRNPLSKRTTVAGWVDQVRAESGGKWRRITPHDLRSTCKSWLSELRVDYETRQRYLDHALEEWTRSTINLISLNIAWRLPTSGCSS